MRLTRTAMKLIPPLPILLLAVSAMPGQASPPAVQPAVPIELAPAGESGPQQNLLPVQGTFSNHFCTGAARDW